MFATICRALRRRAAASLCAARQRLLASLKPATGTPVGGALGELARTKAELLAENALLRRQLLVSWPYSPSGAGSWPSCVSTARRSRWTDYTARTGVPRSA